MKLFVLALWSCLASLAWADAPAAIPVGKAVADHRVTVGLALPSPDQLTAQLRNASPQAITVEVPAGMIAKDASGKNLTIVLRAGTATLAAGETAELSLPAAALSASQPAATPPLALAAETEPKLAPLLGWLATQPDVPKSTAQLAVFCLLENIDFAAWERRLTAERPEAAASVPTPADVTQAIDVLGVLRKIAPEQTFALGADNGLKLRALRNPWCRAKAVQLYGLDAGDGGVAPDLGQLLHTKPGDNCPICRQRALMQQAGNDL